MTNARSTLSLAIFADFSLDADGACVMYSASICGLIVRSCCLASYFALKDDRRLGIW